MTDYMTFDSRETYVVARKAWREDYRTLSQDIRDIKREISKIQREQGSGYASSEQWDRELKRRYATRMLKIRAEMKIKAGEQRAARLAEKVTA